MLNPINPKTTAATNASANAWTKSWGLPLMWTCYFRLRVPMSGSSPEYWSTTHALLKKILSERPSFLQVFSSPMALFVQVPEGNVQDFQAARLRGMLVMKCLSPPASRACNTYNRMCLAKRTGRKLAWQPWHQSIMANMAVRSPLHYSRMTSRRSSTSLARGLSL